MQRFVGTLPVVDCGMLQFGIHNLVVMYTDQSGGRYLLAHGPSVFKHVWGQSSGNRDKEKAWNRQPDGLLPKYQVVNIYLNSDEVKAFAELGGTTGRAPVVRMADVRAVYIFCRRRVTYHERQMEAEERTACMRRLMAWATAIAGNALCVQHNGGAPFTTDTGLHHMLFTELQHMPVTLEPEAAAAPVGEARPSTGRSAPQQARQGPVPSGATAGLYADVYAIPDDVSPVGQPARPAPPPPKRCEAKVHLPPVNVAPEAIQSLRSAGGVDVALLRHVMSSRWAVPPGLKWTFRPTHGRSAAAGAAATVQRELLQEWAVRRQDEIAIAGGGRGPVPEGMLPPLAAEGTSPACPTPTWNAVTHALTHIGVAEKAMV